MAKTKRTVKEMETDVQEDGVRQYRASDAAAVKMLVGQGIMEGLAGANRKSM